MEHLQSRLDSISKPPVLGREHFDAQFQFAQFMRSYTGDTLEDALEKYTSLLSSMWLGEAEEHRGAFELREDNAVDMAYAGYAGSIHEIRTNEAEEKGVYGCFSYDASPEEHCMRIHFANREWASGGPLSNERMNARKKELQVMLKAVRKSDPRNRIIEVRGRSWLYNLASYRRLFPESYIVDPEPVKDMSLFSGDAVWGQFQDDQCRFKKHLYESFMQRLQELGPERAIEALPMPPLSARGPVADFYKLYGIE